MERKRQFSIHPNHNNNYGVIATMPETIYTLEKHKQNFLNKAKSIHSNKYDYSLIEYSGVKNKVTIICSIHGKFNQSPDKHTQGQGCSKCKSELLSKLNTSNTYEFINTSEKIHGNIVGKLNF